MGKDTVRILFVDDEAIVREVFKEKMTHWINGNAFDIPAEIEVEIRGEPDLIDELETEDFDIIVIDQLLGGKAGMDVLRSFRPRTQYMIIMSQNPDELIPIFGDDRVISHFERIVLIPKSVPLRAAHSAGKSVNDLLPVGWWDETLLKWLREMCKRVQRAG